MEEIGSYEAKTHLPRILREVEAGKSFIITRNGKPVARIEPEVEKSDYQKRVEATERMRERAKQLEPVSVEEILEWRDEGRKY